MSGPSLAEVKATGQSPAVVERLNDEHWAGRLYMRKLSPGATWVFAQLGWPPNAVTVGFICCGLAAAGITVLPGLGPAIGAAILMQLYLLLDCADGELARWSGRTSVTGVYLDIIGRYLAGAALLATLGIRAQGQLATAGGYVSAGLAAAVLAMVVEAESDSVIVARAKAGLPAAHSDEALAPRQAGLALARRLASALRVHRIIQPIELSLLILVTAIIDAALGGLTATRVLTVACLVVAAVMVVAHLAAIVASRRLG